MKSALALLACTLLAAPAAAQIQHEDWTGNQVDGWMGFAVASIDDPTSPGQRRLLIGEPNHDHYITAFFFTQSTGAVRCYAGNNLDGAPVFTVYGGEHDRIGRSLAGVGDVNGDGYEDFAVGAPSASTAPFTQHGMVQVRSGQTGAVIHQIDGYQTMGEFGQAVAGAGDTNLDGVPDIVVGAPNYNFISTTTPLTGRVYTFSGATGGLMSTYNGNPHSRLGSSVTGVGDVDNDGRADYAAGAAEDDTTGIQAGRVVVIRGGVPTVWKNLYGDFSNDDYGYDIAGGGDANGDGEPDLIVGAPGVAVDKGMVEVLLGPSFSTSYKVWIAAAANERNGIAVDFAGDVDQDGFDDIVMGSSQSNGAGRVRVLSGKAGVSTLYTSQTGAVAGDGFGSKVAGVGDANGDGWDDILVGEPFTDGVATNDGGARLFGWQFVQPDVGGGGVGSATLSVFGAPLSTGKTATLEVKGAPSFAQAWLLASALQTVLPFKGGTLVPSLTNPLLMPFPMNGSGEAGVPVIAGGGGPYSIYLQMLIKDAAQVQGWQLTHCVRMDVLP